MRFHAVRNDFENTRPSVMEAMATAEMAAAEMAPAARKPAEQHISSWINSSWDLMQGLQVVENIPMAEWADSQFSLVPIASAR